MWVGILTLPCLCILWKVQLAVEELQEFVWRLTELWRVPPEEVIAVLQTPRWIKSRRRTYALEHKIAAGDLCDVHFATSNGEQFIVKAPRVAGAAADEMLEKEFDVLRQLSSDDHYRLYFPEPLESIPAANDGPRINVFAWKNGFYTAGEIATRYPAGLDARHLAWMFKRVLAGLGYVHRQGFVHGAVTPPHMLFHAEDHGLQLIDWIHAVRPGQPLTLVPEEFKDWYPPEARFGAGPGSDIYLAAKTIVYLAGGDAGRNIIPDHVPRAMRAFIEACLLESPRMRPHDAWELHEEFDELLAELYGAPQYVRLSME